MKENTLGTRLKTVRKHLGFKSQAAYAEELGTTLAAYSKYETNVVTPTDSFIKLVCSKFSINEEWLRTGEGEMEQTGKDTLLAQLKAEYQLDDIDTKIVHAFLTLSPAGRQQLKDFIRAITASSLGGSDPQTSAEMTAPAHSAVGDVTDDDLRYAQELSAEERALSASATTDSSDSENSVA